MHEHEHDKEVVLVNPKYTSPENYVQPQENLIG